MKAIIVYSGKGGVGKTTTTANVARTLANQGKKVLVLDADINTPSMNTEFKGDHPHENIWVHSTGNMYDKFIYLEKAMVEKFIRYAKKKLSEIPFDYVLVDTPPSITNIHISLLAELKVSYILFVSQPTQLSRADVLRTASFFRKRCGECPVSLVENMVFPDTPVADYGVTVSGRIPFMTGFNTENLAEVARGEYEKIVAAIEGSEEVDNSVIALPPPYDETFDIRHIWTKDYPRRKQYVMEIERDGEGIKEVVVDKVTFQSLRTWKFIRSWLMNLGDDVGNFCGWNNTDLRLEGNDYDHIKRMLDAFKETNQAYFMVTQAPACEIHLLAGEIGIGYLVTDASSYYGMPRIKYMTSAGEIILFSDEIMPVDAEEITRSVNDGYTLRTDGRYIPPFETLQEVANCFGGRVGLGEGWEKVYEFWQTH